MIELNNRQKLITSALNNQYFCVIFALNILIITIMSIGNKYIKRHIDGRLQEWAANTNRKTLMLRGARQVGKSSAVRELGKQFKYFVEVNFDENEDVKTLFEKSLSPQEICQQLSFLYDTPIVPGETLLFFDEIQSCLPAISKLRYFYEKYPELHLIAAGSLLEFALEEIPSYGVGRIRHLFMYPFSFEEFLGALSETRLVEAYRSASPSKPLFDAVHDKLLNRLRIFLITGGMPSVIAQYAKDQNLLECQARLTDLIVSFRQDFAKYKKRVPSTRITEVFEAVAAQMEGKFVYERAASGSSSVQVKQALELLIMAGLVYPVTHTAANGIPLGAEVNSRYRRMIMCDTGLYQRILGLDTTDLLISEDFKVVNKGAIAEMFVGLEILKSMSCYEPAALYCWAREKKIGNAQVDFVIQKAEQIIPIEVKSGTRGAMQSMREFMKEKNLHLGVRTSLENFSQYEDIDVYPLYAISNLVINK